LDFMNGIIDAYGKEKKIHVILDNLNPTFSTRVVHDPGRRSKWTSWSKGLHYRSDVLFLL